MGGLILLMHLYTSTILLFRQIKSLKLKNQNAEIIYNKYKIYRNTINTLKRKSKKLYYSKYFTDNANNSKNTWKGINKLLNRNKSKQKTIYLQDNDGLINDQRKVANKFNEYFINVGKLSAKIQNKTTKFQDYLKNPNESSLFLKETTPDEVNLIINDLNANKSGDIYDISPKYVKLASLAISLPLAIIFNRSIKEGIFPNKT